MAPDSGWLPLSQQRRDHNAPLNQSARDVKRICVCVAGRDFNAPSKHKHDVHVMWIALIIRRFIDCSDDPN
jgi:hypothetical protein